MSTVHLEQAKKIRNNEFYTLYRYIDMEVPLYKEYFKGKSIYCNCDDPGKSEFWRYFIDHLREWEIKEVIATCINCDGESSVWRCNSEGNIHIEPLGSNGDFRSDPCVELLREADIIVTNPPFTLIREFVGLLAKENKSYLILAPYTVLRTQTVFTLLRDGLLWCGKYNGTMEFTTPSGTLDQMRNICWLTNLSRDHVKPLKLTKTYEDNEKFYSKYVNYDAINVDRVPDIPRDYIGVMGVPITYLAIHCAEQFELLDVSRSGSPYLTSPFKDAIMHRPDGTSKAVRCVNDCTFEIPAPPTKGVYYEKDGKYYRNTYVRVLIRRKRPA